MSGDHSRHPLPRFGMLTSPIESVQDEAERFHKLGFDFVEIGIEELTATPRILMHQKDRILSAISANGLFAIGHTAYWVGFGSSHEKVRSGWIEEGKDVTHTPGWLTNGVFMMVLKIDNFVPLEDFKDRIDRLVRPIKAEGFEEILIPGEPESNEREMRLGSGIPIPEKAWQPLVQACKQYGVDVESLMRV